MIKFTFDERHNNSLNKSTPYSKGRKEYVFNRRNQREFWSVLEHGDKEMDR